MDSKEKKGIKIWVDDIRKAPDASWITCKTVESAISAIARFGDEITEISLDHDISHQVRVGDISRPYPCDETFKSVAHFIGMRIIKNFYKVQSMGDIEDYWNPKITIHSANSVGAEEMKKILVDDYDLDESDVVISGLPPANGLEG